MARFLLSFILASVLALATLHGTHAVEFVVFNRALNTPGGVRFRNQLGRNYTQQRMRAATDFIWNLFKETAAADRKSVARVSLFVDDMDGIAYTINDEIHVGAKYIQGIKGDIKTDFNGVLFHEMTHVWQWNGKGQAPGGLIEGIADFVRLKANYVPNGSVKPGQGQRWDEGYSITARFLDYCNGLKKGFVAELNKKMRNGYSDSFFNQLLGKTVDQLWKDYKAKFGN
ncbi:PREDICTED: uncharacterized protein LOC101310442 [Fragaria vesca subsp. vesca]|uniref:uncharacterized protein LOC101310442 n=1 Tax=Fragaria vesca subsp. vesca TaxID=101020 RepID=UPI0002C2FA54|nr:PREDICTED: uncharacterized protein LOC101310442 [Fragaria vesca subsp. vesca]